MPGLSIMFVAGDPSGDQHASQVLGRLTTILPEARCFGIGGPAMTSEGFEPLLPFEEFNRMGIVEVLAHLPFFLKAKRKLIAAMDEQKPRVLVCVDYPGLNIGLLREAYKRKIPVVWYIVPQVWAWKKKRAAILGNLASFIGAVFPFEVDFFKQYPAPISFVGHPLIEALQEKRKAAVMGIQKTGRRRLSLIPGSRRQEVLAMLPVMVPAAKLLVRRYPDLSVAISKCRGLPLELYQKASMETGFEIIEGPLADLLDQTDAAFVTSGTATLETALAGVPMVIAYRTSRATYALLKRMVRVPFIGLPNIIAGEKIVPECIQQEANAENLAEVMTPFIDSEELRRVIVTKLLRLKDVLGSKTPSEEIARAIAGFVQ
jgi:lipid-A-disaccharide synthase